MTKKHFIAVAKMIAELEDRKEADYLAIWFAEFFKKYNPRFDDEKFLSACNYRDWQLKDKIKYTFGVIPNGEKI